MLARTLREGSGVPNDLAQQHHGDDGDEEPREEQETRVETRPRCLGELDGNGDRRPTSCNGLGQVHKRCGRASSNGSTRSSGRASASGSTSGSADTGVSTSSSARTNASSYTCTCISASTSATSSCASTGCSASNSTARTTDSTHSRA